jgi:hypothetical protein
VTLSGAQHSWVVLFDLFGTLVPGGSGDERDVVSRLIANDFGVDPEEFATLVRTAYDERMRGTLGDLRETLAHLARTLGAHPSTERLEAAALQRLALTRGFSHRSGPFRLSRRSPSQAFESVSSATAPRKPLRSGMKAQSPPMPR